MPALDQNAWLRRDAPVFQYYIASALDFSILALALVISGCALTLQRFKTLQLATDASNRHHISGALNKRLLRISRIHFLVAVVYIVNASLTGVLDAIFSFLEIRK